MKNIKKIVISLFAVLCLFVVTSCNDKNTAKVEFLKNSITLQVGEKEDLRENVLLKLTKTNLENVRFSSINAEVAFVSDDFYIKAVNVGLTTIKAKVGEFEASVIVNVSKAAENFEKVSALSYQPSSGVFSWNPAYLISSANEKILASEYKIEITKNNIEFTNYTKITNTSYKILEAGNYQVNISARAESYDWSVAEQITFMVLPQVSGLAFEKSASEDIHKIIWDEVLGATKYELKVNNDEFETTTNFYNLTIAKSGTYEIAVRAINQSEGSADESSIYTDNIIVTKLQTPVFNIDNGVVKVDPSQAQLVKNYSLTTKNYEDTSQESIVLSTNGIFDLDSLTAGNYIISAKAIADSENGLVISSDETQTVQIEKLASPTLEFDKLTKTISVKGGLDNANVFIKDIVSGNVETFLMSDLESTITLDKTFGEYEIWSQNLAKTQNKVSSGNSNTIFVKVLSFPADIEHRTEKINEISKSFISFQSVVGADSYRISVNGQVVTATEFEIQGNRRTYVLEQGTNEIFNQAGEYEIVVEAVNTTFEDKGTDYYLVYFTSQTNKALVTRLAASELIEIANPATLAPITWQSVENAISYDFTLLKNNEIFRTGKAENTSLDISDLEFGNYEIQIITVGNDIDYLTSLTLASANFKVIEEIAVPTLSFDRQEQQVVIKPTTNADIFEVYFENELILILDEVLSFDVSNYLQTSGEYTFEVIAKNTLEDFELGGNLIQSAKASISIARLAAIENIIFENQSMFIVDNGIELGSLIANEFDVEVKIDDEVIDINQLDVSGLSNFKLSITKIANQALTAPYYVSSEEFVVYYDRLITPQNILFENWNVSWDAVVGSEGYVVDVTVQGISEQIIVDSSSINIEAFQFYDVLQSGFEFTVKAIVTQKYITNNQTDYLSSFESSLKVIEVLDAPIILSVEKQAENSYLITWQIVENAQSYITNFKGVQSTLETNQITLELDGQKTSQVFEVWAFSQNYVGLQKSSITFEKIDSIKQIEVNQNQTFKFNQLPENYKDILVNQIAVSTDEEIEIINQDALVDFQYVYTIQAQAEFKQGDIYYLNSDETIFSFKKYDKVTNLRIQDNSIMWDVQADAQQYEIFINKVVEQEVYELSLLIPARSNGINVSSILLSDSRIVDFISGFESEFNFDITIKVKTINHILQDGEISFIDSDLSEIAQLDRLEKAINLQINSIDGDNQQKSLVLTWDVVEFAEFYNVYVNGALLFENQTESEITTDLFTFDNSLDVLGQLTGVFDVQVVAYASNKLPSKNSDSLNFVRLDKVKNFISTNNLGSVQWDKNLISQKYVLHLQTQDGYKSDDIFVENIVEYNFNSLLEEDINFAQGSITFNIYVLGEGNIFSSESEKVVQIRLDKPVFEVGGKVIKISESNIHPQSTFNVKVFFENALDSSKVEIAVMTLPAGENTLPEVWKYKDGQEITQAGKFIFEVTTISDGYITSIKTVEEIVKLNPAEIDGVKKLINQDGEHLFVLLTSVNNVAQTEENINPVLQLIIKIENDIDNEVFEYIDDNITNRQGQIEYNNKEMFYAMRGNFKVSIMFTGVGYLDSKFVSINGTRLNQNQSLGENNGVLTWQRTTQNFSTGYLLNVHHGAIDEETPAKLVYKHIPDLSIINDDLNGIAGQITANIKVLGNMVADEVTLNNIVLDSFFMGKVTILADDSLVFDEEAYSATKLYGPKEVTINQGMFHINKTDETGRYSIIALDSEYQGREYNFMTEYEDEEVVQGLSLGFYQGSYTLQIGQVYTFAIKSLSINSNMLNSDAIGEIKVKVIDGVTNFDVAWKEDGPISRMDKVSITWASVSGAAGYIITINANSIMQDKLNIVSTNEYILQSNNALSNKSHNFQVRAMGSSAMDGEGVFTLTSRLSSSIELRGLGMPKVKITNGLLNWDIVQNAEGYYIYYMRKDALGGYIDKYKFSQYKTWHSEFVTKTSWQVPDSFGDDNTNMVYYFAVVAINTDISYRLMPSAYGSIYGDLIDGETGEIVTENVFYPVTVLKAPDVFENNEGVSVWTGDYNWDFTSLMKGELKGGTSPFVYGTDIQEMLETLIKVKVKAESGYTFTKDIEAIALFDADILKSALFKELAADYGIDSEQKFGIGHIDQFINEIFPNIKAGNNNISAMQVGDNKFWISSKYNVGKNIYVPAQVHSTLYNNILSWHSVDLPNDILPYNSIYKYNIVSEDEQGNRILLTRTNDLSIDLMEFVNSEVLKPGMQKIYVFVSGDSGTYVHGIVNQPITTFILPAINARMENGRLYWDSMQQTNQYIVSAQTDGQYDSFTEIMTVNTWDFSQLNARDSEDNSIEYNLTLQALGNGKTIISGRVTRFGTIIKLETPEVSIQNGIFTWQNKDNNFGYEIDVQGDYQNIIWLNKNITEYESPIKGFNNYNFRTLGSTTAALEEGSLNYAISSKMQNELYAVMLNSVQSIEIDNGRIIWQSVNDLLQNAVESYKLTFDQSNFYAPIFLGKDDISTQVINDRTYVVYNLPQDYNAGKFIIHIQGLSNQSYTFNGKNYMYLLSEIESPNSTVVFEKLQKAENAKSENGVITWDDLNSSLNTYKLTFVQGAQTFEFFTDTPSFNPTDLRGGDQLKYELITAESIVNVRVQILGNSFDLINSDTLIIADFEKLQDLVDFTYRLDEVNQNGFMIRWYLPVDYVTVSNYEYVISYINDDQTDQERVLSSLDDPHGYIKKGYDSERQRYYGEIEASNLLGLGSYKLEYRVAIVPISASPIIPSNYSAKSTVRPPISLNGEFTFNQEKQEISWLYEEEVSDVNFRITDELVEVDENGIVTVIKTNVYISKSRQFYPKEIGLHRVKIAVVLLGGNVSSGYVYFFQQQTVNGLVNHQNFIEETPYGNERFTLIELSLFGEGDGSNENPYTVENQTHFENINHRLSKPTYFGEEQVFYFIQTQNLTALNLTKEIGNFAGNYDGQGFEIDYTLISSETAQNQEVGLFKGLARNGVIKNLSIRAKIILQNAGSVSSVKLSALVVVNNGRIENLLIKAFDIDSKILTSMVSYSYGSIANQNNTTGYITKAINKANLIIGQMGQTNISNSSFTFTVGGIVENNQGILFEVGSQANIKIKANRVTIAGIAVSSQQNAVIERAYNTGIFEATYSAANSLPTISYIGGLVGINRGAIYSSYNKAEKFSVNFSEAAINTVHIGGLVGSAVGTEGGLISNSFTTTTDIVILNKNASTVQVGLLIGNDSSSSHPAQTTNYYSNTVAHPFIYGESNMKCEAIQTLQNLFEKLNSVDSVFDFENNVLKLNWEAEFNII